MNKVFNPGTEHQMTQLQLAEAANAVTLSKPFTSADFVGENSRLQGNLCACGGFGEFELLPIEESDYWEGKRYIQCRKCGCCTSL